MFCFLLNKLATMKRMDREKNLVFFLWDGVRSVSRWTSFEKINLFVFFTFSRYLFSQNFPLTEVRKVRRDNPHPPPEKKNRGLHGFQNVWGKVIFLPTSVISVHKNWWLHSRLAKKNPFFKFYRLESLLPEPQFRRSWIRIGVSLQWYSSTFENKQWVNQELSRSGREVKKKKSGENSQVQKSKKSKWNE